MAIFRRRTGPSSSGIFGNNIQIAQEARFRSLASCGAFHICFIGFAHEFIGAQLFPWAPQVFGPILWHLAGLSIIAIGALLLAGTLRLIRFPVVPLALITAAVGVITVILIAALHRQFHFLALSMLIASVVTATCHRKAEKLHAAWQRLDAPPGIPHPAVGARK